MKKTKLFLRKQLLLLAMVCGTTAYAQEYGDKYYYDWFQKSSTGEIIYDEGSQDAWVTTIDNKEWTVDDIEGCEVTFNDDGTIKFGRQAAGTWGSMTSPNFDTNTPLVLEVDLAQLQHGTKKNHMTISFVLTYQTITGESKTYNALADFNFAAASPYIVDQQNVDIEIKGDMQYTITLILPNDFYTDGHTQINFYAEGGLTLGASSNGTNKIDVYSEELVLRDDWDNTERLTRNAGKQLKKVIIVREYTKGWYTLSLPFDLTMKQFQHRFWKSFVKANADSYDWAKESCAEIWHYADFSTDTKVMNFRKHDTDENVLVAGVPYLIYIPEDIKTTLVDFVKEAGVGADVENPDITENDKYKQMVFTNIVLKNPPASVSKVTDGEASFASNLSKTDIADVMASNQVYYLSTDAAGENPVLKTPNSESTNIKGFRAYFMTPKGSSTLAKQSLFFAGDDVVTAINKVDAQPTTNAPVYNMQGLRMNSDLKSLPRGMYIVNGKKYVIK